MKFIHLFFMLVICFVSSCNNKKENQVSKTTALLKQDTLVPLQVTVLADLPDSLQPEIILLENAPAPKTVRIPDKPTSVPIHHKTGQIMMDLKPTRKIKSPLSSVLQNYTTEQGLAQDVISCVYADKKGNLWMGTHVGGVSKYDGHAFTNYTTSHGLVDNRIHEITEDRAGNIWFATMSGVSKFDGTTFSTFGKFKNVSTVLLDRTGTLWIGERGTGLYKYAGDSITRFSQLDGLWITSLKEDKSGIVYIGTDKGLFRFDGEKFIKIALFGVKYLATDKSGNIWAENTRGFVKYEGTNIKSYPSALDMSYNDYDFEDRLETISSQLNKSDGFTFGSAEDITADKLGNIWFGTSAQGIFKYSGQTFQKLSDNSIRSIFEDEGGNLWFSGEFGSLFRFDGEYFTIFELNNDTYWSLFQDKLGNIWTGGHLTGLIKFDKKSYTFYTDLNGVAGNAVKSITQDSKGNLWIGTETGLSKFDGRSFTNFKKRQGLAGDYVACILENKPGELLIGTDSGLSLYDGKSFTNYSLNRMPQGNDIRSMVKDTSGNLWMGTYGGGLVRYDGKTFTTYTTEQGLPDNVVTQVALTKEENIIVGTNNGIAILTGFKYFSDATANNLNNTSANRSYRAQNNLSNSELKKYIPVFEIYNPNTGYPVMDVNRGQHGIFEDSKGFLWIASGSKKSGLMRFDYSSLNKNNNPPQLNILSIKVDNEPVGWYNLLNSKKNDQKPTSAFETITVPASVAEEVTTFGKQLSDVQREEMRRKYKGIEFDGVSKFYPVPQHLVLPYDHNNLTIEFAAIDTDKPNLVQYQYILEGYNKNWSTPANITSATFGNMYEGKYHLKVKARSPSGIWSEPITYSFDVLPPWWRTWWAYLGYTLLFLLALRIFSKYRERHLRAEKEKLEQTVEERTKELKSSQTQLIQSEKMASLGELTAGIAHEIQNPLNFVNNFSEVSSELLEEMENEMDMGDIEEAKALASDIRSNLEKINFHGKRADAIVKGMLQHSRSNSGQKDITDINALCNEFLRLSFHGIRAKDKTFNAAFETRLDPSLPKIEVVPQDIGRVILNLINNAFYAVNEKSKAESKKDGSDYQPVVSVSTAQQPNSLIISIKDNGSGIPEHIKYKIFQPFFTTKPTGQGTGLGLSLSYDIVKAHGGELKVESVEGIGSTFIILLSLKT